MEILVRILIVDDDQVFVQKLRDLVVHPQILIDNTTTVSKESLYNFFVLGGSTQIVDAIDTIRELCEGIPIYLSGKVCEANVSIRKLIGCNIVACLENDESMKDFVKKITSFRKQKCRLREASCKLDRLKAGDLKALARQLKQTESDKFVDYIQNHPLPMVLVSCEYDVLHANSAMENMIGAKLSGASASTYYVDPTELDDLIAILGKEGQVLGATVTLKNIDGDTFPMKLYTSLHRDRSGNWLNTRCLFVPIEQCPE